MNDEIPMYKDAEEGEVLGGVMKPYEPKFVEAKTVKLVDELKCTDALMTDIMSRIPKPVRLDIQ